MPELPEVETTCRGIAPFAKGQKISRVIVRQSKLRWPVDQLLDKKLAGQTIINIRRRAKYLLLDTDIGSLMIHLGMSGSLRIVEQLALKKHDHVDICLCNGKTIRFNDPRRFGSIILNQQGEQHSLLAKLGIEPLEHEFNGRYLHSKAKGRNIAIKSFIMNNHIVVGVGNIYAQESLFLSGIHPNRAACKISLARLEKLVLTIKQVLARAIEAGGSSLKDFTGADGKPGYFQQTLNVYARGNQACLKCQIKLKQVTIGQRTTVYCPQCQR
jgi:formamidopyrimidine-DNA glycosylase